MGEREDRPGNVYRTLLIIINIVFIVSIRFTYATWIE